MKPRYPYFKLTKTVKDPNDLLKYFQDIMNLGIACCVAEDKRGWALWREGIEAKDKTDTNTKINRDKIGNRVYVIYDTKNVFGLQVELQKENKTKNPHAVALGRLGGLKEKAKP